MRSRWDNYEPDELELLDREDREALLRAARLALSVMDSEEEDDE